MKPKHFISLVVLVFGAMFLYIAKFIINDDYYMINLMRQKYHVISTEKKVSKRTAYDTIKSSDSTSITDDSNDLQHSDATTGTGLNLLLMDSLTEGYVVLVEPQPDQKNCNLGGVKLFQVCKGYGAINQINALNDVIQSQSGKGLVYVSQKSIMEV